MITAAYFILSVVLGAVLYFGIRWLVKACSKYRGTRTVACPETGRPALAEIDALHASLTSLIGPPDIRLENCSPKMRRLWRVRSERLLDVRSVQSLTLGNRHVSLSFICP
jgi:hypothetical protein